MPFLTPTGETHVEIEGLGTLKGFSYSNGVRQFCGVPYGRLTKRWTRASLADSWPNRQHDGTKLGCSAPNPPEFSGPSLLTPVPNNPNFNIPIESELDCLVMNIAMPPDTCKGPHPIMLYIHGGAWIYGGSNGAVVDGVHLVSHSVAIGMPVIVITINYRVGFGGFLASDSIRDELRRDGFEGVGNFALTDQQIALEWVQKYGPQLAGDKDNVTIFGLSAGGVSVAHQLAARHPAVFHRAVCMSGNIETIPTWPLAKHQQLYEAMLKHVGIDPDSPDALDRLRQVPEETITAATCPLAGTILATGNPCDDGWFYEYLPSISNFQIPKERVKAFMVGDVYDEAMIVRANGLWTSEILRERMSKYMSLSHVKEILNLYELAAEKDPVEFRRKLEEMAGDSMFHGQNDLVARRSQVPETYVYHFDVQCSLNNPLKDLSYHAIDLLYVFMNLQEEMSEEEVSIARQLATDYVTFAHGNSPWEPFPIKQRRIVYEPTLKRTLKTESEYEHVRKYSRTKAIEDLGVYQQFVTAMDDLILKRYLMGTPDALSSFTALKDRMIKASRYD